MKRDCSLLASLICLVILLSTASSASGAETKIRFVKEDTVCQEILDLGLTAGTMLYGNNLSMRYNSSGGILGASHGMSLRIEVYPEADGARKYFDGLPVYKLSRSMEVLENIRNSRRISWIEKAANITGTSRYILFRDNIIIIIKGTSLNTSGYDVGKAADILEKHALTILGDKLQEYFFSGVVKGSNGQPLGNIRLVLEVGGQPYVTTTDASGYYSIEYKGPVNKDLECTLYAVLQNKRNDKVYYRVIWQDTQVWVSKSFRLKSARDLMQDLDFRDVEKRQGIYDGKPDLKLLPHFSAMYYHMSEALNFYLDCMKFNLDYKLPVDVVAGYNYGTLYDPTTATIHIDYEDSSYRSPDRPMNREWHEFSHHAMFSMYGRWPSHPAGTINHAGFVNPSTGDSFCEGFAEFMSMMIADYYKYPNPHVYAKSGSLEANYRSWDYRGRAEEFAVAGILWDLYDGLNDDRVQLTINDIWYLLKDYNPDFSSVYDTLIKRLPAKKAAIDEVFVVHGFFTDKTAGNGKWDPIEPFTDTNRNRKYDTGEYFVDYGLPKIEYTRGESIGPASNYQRQQRKSAGAIEGQYIKVSNQVPYYLVEVSFPNQSGLNYKLTTHNRNGLIYVHMPPPEYNAVITVKPEGAKAGSILTFRSQDYVNNISESIERGYFLEHDFQVSGVTAPGSELPPASPGHPGKEPPIWDILSRTSAKPDDYKYTEPNLEFLPSRASTPASTTAMPPGASVKSFGSIGVIVALALLAIVIAIVRKKR